MLALHENRQGELDARDPEILSGSRAGREICPGHKKLLRLNV